MLPIAARAAGSEVDVVDWLLFAVQWLHVIAAITWFGSVIYADFILIPALLTLSPAEQRRAGAAVGDQGSTVIKGAAIAVIVFGILRGTVYGPIKSLDALTTAYGMTWLVALVLALFTFYWGVKVLGGAIGRLDTIDESRATLPDGTVSPEMAAAIADIRRKGMLELVFFLAIFSCMILMRFGL